MMRSTLIGLVVCCILTAALIFGWTPLQERLRAGRIKQCKSLGNGSFLQIDELYRQSDTSFEVGKNPLFVRCHYLGDGPYGSIEPALLAYPGGPKLDCGNVVECASPFKDVGHPTVWRFSKAPERIKEFTMRITFNPGGADERHVDFILPNSLKPWP